MIEAALARLGRTDPVMRKLIREVGPCTMRPTRAQPFESLVRAVAHQQLHGTAAKRILARFVALTPRRFPRPQDVAAFDDQTLRTVGFSRAKILAVRDIADKTLAGLVPSSRELARLADEEVIVRLTEVRGVGRWTAEILLMRAGRLDVLPADDFGLRSGFRHAYRLSELPTAKALRAHGERWAPYRSYAAWYLWRAADRAKIARDGA